MIDTNKNNWHVPVKSSEGLTKVMSFTLLQLLKEWMQLEKVRNSRL